MIPTPFHSPDRARRHARALVTVLLGVSVAACGGGNVRRPAAGAEAPSATAARARVSQAPTTALPSAAPVPAAIAALQPGEWLELRDTKIRSVLPQPPQRGDATSIVKAWSGGTVDQNRARLLVWGGGHGDYLGNEMYALDLGALSIQRVVDPSPATAQSACTSTLPDGAPASRHTYDALTFITHGNPIFATHGRIATCGWAA